MIFLGSFVLVVFLPFTKFGLIKVIVSLVLSNTLSELIIILFLSLNQSHMNNIVLTFSLSFLYKGLPIKSDVGNKLSLFSIIP